MYHTAIADADSDATTARTGVGGDGGRPRGMGDTAAHLVSRGAGIMAVVDGMSGRDPGSIGRISDMAVEMVIARYEAADAILAPAMPGLSQGSRWDQLEQWLTLRADAGQFLALVQAWGQQVGMDAAVRVAIREANRLETGLARAGGWDGTDEDLPVAVGRGKAAVEGRALTRLLMQAQKAADKAEQMLARPRYRLTPVTPPADLVAQVVPGLADQTPVSPMLTPRYQPARPWTSMRDASRYAGPPADLTGVDAGAEAGPEAGIGG